MNNASYLVDDARKIWKAGVDAVTPARLFQNKVFFEGSVLSVEHVCLDLAAVRRLVVVGAGKASAAMAIAFQKYVLSKLAAHGLQPELRGWINSPAGTFSEAERVALGSIQLHAARPAGVNEPTEAAVHGTQRILELVQDCNEQDVILCLLSGGGSALLTAPKAGITLADKQAVARVMSAAGADISQLNTVRRALSDIKGGGLARACHGGRLITLIISDVLGDPLDTIASGPTVLESATDAAAALSELQALGLMQDPALGNVVRCLQANESKRPTRRAEKPADHRACHSGQQRRCDRRRRRKSGRAGISIRAAGGAGSRRGCDVPGKSSGRCGGAAKPTKRDRLLDQWWRAHGETAGR